MSISQRHAAVAAGLGEFGWLGIVLTRNSGLGTGFGAILTTAELEPDPMYSGPRICQSHQMQYLQHGVSHKKPSANMGIRTPCAWSTKTKRGISSLNTAG